jgi:poly(A) polymerase/tRNA nucleotidyltransferase (CCA-adding enzyme)
VSDAPALWVDPPAFLADPALAEVLNALPEARVVGGAVRDALSGHAVVDVDLATPREPATIARALADAGIRALPTGIDHGTLTALVQGKGFEVTTLRRDVETDGRHAVVAFTTDWHADAARRDFTINALSMTRDGAVFDYFGGLADLRAGIVRFVGDPATRIAEDHLRILRFFRFHARYAAVPPVPAVCQALQHAAPLLLTLSPERVWGELKRILAAPDPGPTVALMAELGVLAAAIPEGADPARLHRMIMAGGPADPVLRAAALLIGDPTEFALRLRLSGSERDRLAALHDTPPVLPDTDDAELRRRLAETDAPVLIGRTWLDGDTDPAWSALRLRISITPRPVFPLEGRDVLALGLTPGPDVGALLREVRAWWLKGGCSADAETLRLELMRRIGRRHAP